MQVATEHDEHQVVVVLVNQLRSHLHGTQRERRPIQSHQVCLLRVLPGGYVLVMCLEYARQWSPLLFVPRLLQQVPRLFLLRPSLVAVLMFAGLSVLLLLRWLLLACLVCVVMVS